MSNAALNWAFATPLPKAVDKLLLVCLANRADDKGICYPSQARIVTDTSLDRKTVIAGLKRLEESGLIQDTKQRTGATKQITVYRMALDRDLSVPEFPANRPTFPAPHEVETVPSIPGNCPVLPTEESRLSHETVPFVGHGTIKEPPLEEPSREPPLSVREGAGDLFAIAPAPAPVITPRPKRVKPEDSPEFTAFWAAYPRKAEGPGAARGPWQRAIAKADPAEIVAGVARYAFNPDQQFLPMASTWLNQERWRGQANTAPATVAAPVSQRLAAQDVIRGRPIGTSQAVVAATLRQARAPPQRPREPPPIDLPPGDWTRED